MNVLSTKTAGLLLKVIVYNNLKSQFALENIFTAWIKFTSILIFALIKASYKGA
jgi:hypothetical protein